MNHLEKLETNDSVIKRRLKDMINKGIIRRVGSNKGSHWEVVAHV